MRRGDSPELHVLAAGVHGALSALHALGLVYNWRRGNRGDALVHALALAYDAHATAHHVQAVRSVALVAVQAPAVAAPQG